MNVFDFRDRVIQSYGEYVRSFFEIRDERIREKVTRELDGGFLWPDPLVQLNPAFKAGDPLKDLVKEGTLHPECEQIFSTRHDDGQPKKPFRLYEHQVESIRAAAAGDNYVLTTGTGSGKSLAYIVPIVNHVLRRGSGRGIREIVVYPMNALANSQKGELEKFLCRGYPEGHPPVRFARYTGQESDDERREIIKDPPDILLTNYVMLELVLTRFGKNEEQLVAAAHDLRFLVLDELHTYRGRQGADVAMLVRRTRAACKAKHLIHVGTSATLASGGPWTEQQAEVAAMASDLFGATVKPRRVIGETLRQVTMPADVRAPSFRKKLRERVRAGSPPTTSEAFLSDLLSSWMESKLGIAPDPCGGRLVRRRPRSIDGKGSASEELAELVGLDTQVCVKALRATLLAGQELSGSDNRSLFAFRLHQFVSKGDLVYASPEAEDARHITLTKQTFVPGSGRTKVLLPLAFCRECGQEYYVVRRGVDDQGTIAYSPREVRDRESTAEHSSEFLYISRDAPWPDERHEYLKLVPESWLEMQRGVPTVRRSQRKNLPRKVWISPAGEEAPRALTAWRVPAPFRFCLRCQVAYGPHQKSDFGKLATLGSEGRSTATTVMSLASIRTLRRDRSLQTEARKLLSFTDNRQDAALQAGHFNDFVELVMLRSALWRAVTRARPNGIRHDMLTLRVFQSLNLPVHQYAADPDVKYAAREETDRALRDVLGYYLYRDLRRGWRITSPNLEQCGLLAIDYLSLDAVCRDDSEWKKRHPVLAAATAEERTRVCRVLLDHLRRELAIRVTFLDPAEQESMEHRSHQRLAGPWALDDEGRMEQSTTALSGSRRRRRGARFVFLSPRGGFGLFLKRPGVFTSPSAAPLTMKDVEQIIDDLMATLTVAGILHRSMEPANDHDVPGYQLNASAMIWRASDDASGMEDPIRVPRRPMAGLRANPFFRDFYRADTEDLRKLKAREHTAQVQNVDRQRREEQFRAAELPVMYCSPTMELGVDIAQLNVVNMRNVPPTPANYAQRSGRAGRSGQPAFVFTYCAGGSPHDQYFFRRQKLMVSGAVTTPRLDLGNEDLLCSHVHAVWLSASGLALGHSMRDIVDLENDSPTVSLQSQISNTLADSRVQNAAFSAAWASLGGAIRQLVRTPPGEQEAERWLRRVLKKIPMSFRQACSRWWDLYRAARAQSTRQQRIVLDPSRPPRDRRAAKRLRAEAETQLALLLDSESVHHSDFYTYRYLASEGFLPGYNFPRLPLSAFLPKYGRRRGRDDFLSRPRFLAISEFGPRSIVYHEGSRYVISKVILPVESEETRLKSRAVRCSKCGYMHPLGDEPEPDLCESCAAALPHAMGNLFRMQNVSTRRRQRISSDEEERFRLGFEIRSGVRFAERKGAVSSRSAIVRATNGQSLAKLIYGDSATLWRINFGWRRRSNRAETGFVLNVERGIWATSQSEDTESRDPMSANKERLIPYVEEQKNCLLVEPATRPGTDTMASLQAVLKVAIQVEFQLENRELAAEPLPDEDNRRQILLYEASEGGAGVLQHLVDEPARLAKVARRALEIAHFDPETGEDLGRAAGASEECDAGCYDCLLSYSNQRDHRHIDRHRVRELLMEWRDATVVSSPTLQPRAEQVGRLLNLCQSELERRWVRRVDRAGLRLPSEAQLLIESCSTRPDFLYADNFVAVYIDGPHHDSSARRAADRRTQDDLENAGYSVIRFHHKADWAAIFEAHADTFGSSRTGGTPA